MLEMALLFPAAKKEDWLRRSVLMDTAVGERLSRAIGRISGYLMEGRIGMDSHSADDCMLKIKYKGIFCALVCVMRNSVMTSKMVASGSIGGISKY